MASASHHLLLILLCHLLTVTTVSAVINFSCAYSNGNFTADSVYQTNLNTVLSDVVTNTTIDYGFYNFTSGGGIPNRVNVLALCRADVTLSNCQICLNQTRSAIRRQCPQQKEAIIWYDNCMLRYSNQSIFRVMKASPQFYKSNHTNATSPTQFNKVLRNLLNTLRRRAIAGDSMRKFAAGYATAPNFQTLYALMQCTPDLSRVRCNDCLVGAVGEIPNCCHSKIGGRVMRPSCNLRFEMYRFYSALPVPASPPPRPAAGKGSGSSNTVIIVSGSVAAAVCTAAGIVGVCIFLRKKMKRNSSPAASTTVSTVDEIISAESLQFNFETIKAATNNFSEENILGRGGFGIVYKGMLDGTEIAVKRLSAGMSQGGPEFMTEVVLVAKLQHRNLVHLLGFCKSGIEMLLMYEFVPNTSLDRFIFDVQRRSLLDWKIRYKIIQGIARGLVYLHEDPRLRIIHRDLKASNVLLDAEMAPKIADFGLAKLFGVGQTKGITDKTVGTYGYMAPEYIKNGQFSMKSDVFSFGVLILETITGQRNYSFRSRGEATVEKDLLSSAWLSWSRGTIQNILDPTLQDGSRNEILRCIHIALLCVQENTKDRPTMGSVIMMLNSFSVTLQLPSQPPAPFLQTLKETDTSALME